LCSPKVLSPSGTPLPTKPVADEILAEISAELERVEGEIEVQESEQIGLQARISEATAERIRYLPTAVQREHDAVEAEIADLNWHLTRATRKLNSVSAKKEQCDVTNKRLVESIQSIDKHAPMVEDKLKLEQREMKIIEAKQVEADAVYQKTKAQLDRIDAEFKVRTNRLDEEKYRYDMELEEKREYLANLKRELLVKKTEYEDYCSNIELLKENQIKCEHAAEKLNVDTEKAQEQEGVLTDELQVLKQKVQTLDEEFEKKTAEKEQLDKTIAVETRRNKEILGKLREETDVLTKELLAIQDQIKLVQMDIEDCQEEHKSSQQQIDHAHRETDRLVNEKARCERDLQQSTSEQQSLMSKMSLVQLQLDQETKKIYSIESKLKARVDGLRKTQQTNFQAKTLLEQKIERCRRDLISTKQENERKMADAKAKAELAEAMCKTQQEKLAFTKARLEVVERDRDKLAKKIAEYIAQTDSQMSTLQTEETELQTEHRSINAEVCQLKTRISNIKTHSEKLHNEKKDMEIQCKTMITKIANGQESLRTLEELIVKKKAEVDREQALNDELALQLETTQKRIAKRCSENEAILVARKAYFRQIMSELRAELDRNERLAVIFKQVQAYNLAAKQAVLSVNEKRNRVELSVSEQEKIIELQKKTCRRLETVLERQEIANSARMEYLNFTTALNSNALGVIKSELVQTTEECAEFISKYVDTK